MSGAYDLFHSAIRGKNYSGEVFPPGDNKELPRSCKVSIMIRGAT